MKRSMDDVNVRTHINFHKSTFQYYVRDHKEKCFPESIFTVADNKTT